MYLAIRLKTLVTAPGRPNGQPGEVVSVLPDDWLVPRMKWRLDNYTTGEFGFHPAERTEEEINALVQRLRDRTGHNFTARLLMVQQDFGSVGGVVYGRIRVPDITQDDVDSLLFDHPSHHRRFGFEVASLAQRNASFARTMDITQATPLDDVPELLVDETDALLWDATNEMRPVIKANRRQWAQDRRAAIAVEASGG